MDRPSAHPEARRRIHTKPTILPRDFQLMKQAASAHPELAQDAKAGTADRASSWAVNSLQSQNATPREPVFGVAF